MTAITDEYMREMIAKTRSYTIIILRMTEKRSQPGADRIIWEHGRRNFALRQDGLLPVVCPVADGSEVSGIGIFDGTVDEVRKIMDEDPGVQAGIFTYELHTCRGFPGSCLPA